MLILGLRDKHIRIVHLSGATGVRGSTSTRDNHVGQACSETQLPGPTLVATGLTDQYLIWRLQACIRSMLVAGGVLSPPQLCASSNG